MGAPLPALEISTNDLIKLFRAWGWQFVSEGTKQARFKKDRATITIKRTKIAAAEPANEAAILEGITLEDWLRGPINKEPQSSLDQDDIDWFLRTKVETLTDREEKSRYRHIRHVLTQEGTIKQYLKIAEKTQVTANFERGPDNPAAAPKKIEPLPVKPNLEGYISLADALALRNLKINGLSQLACELISVLAAKGPFADEDGGTTRRIAEHMPAFNRPHRGSEPVGLTAISTQIKLWEDAGLLWRETKGQTHIQGRAVDPRIFLTPEQAERFLWVDPESVEILAERIEEEERVLEESTVGADDSSAGEVDLEDAPSLPTPAPSYTDSHEDPAVHCLQEEIKKHQLAIDRLEYAIDVLTREEV